MATRTQNRGSALQGAHSGTRQPQEGYDEP